MVFQVGDIVKLGNMDELRIWNVACPYGKVREVHNPEHRSPNDFRIEYKVEFRCFSAFSAEVYPISYWCSARLAELTLVERNENV
jgi:hypothetical protein